MVAVAICGLIMSLRVNCTPPGRPAWATALWTMMSSPPKRFTASSTVASTSAASVTSHCTNTASWPAARIDSAAGSPLAARLAAITTEAPAAASAVAIPAPTP